MELLALIRIIKKRLWLILLISIVCSISVAIISKYLIKPVYEAKSTLIIGHTPTTLDEKVRYDDVLMYQKLTKTYAELAKSNLVAEEVVLKSSYKLLPGEVQSKLKVTIAPDTQILEIAIQDSDPEKAAELANVVSQVFENEVRLLLKAEDVKIMDKATVPKFRIKPRPIANAAIAGLLGLMISLGIVFLLEYLDNTMKTEEDVKKYLQLNVLASIPYTFEKEIYADKDINQIASNSPARL